ncbi:MAG: hypothetical protein ING36_09685 [Burkholderiales bacterium]|jgi:uncharacterized protein YecT (DUF1311 family)|nr:hypothetical protein [Burkholderiales bacterium]
MSNKMFLKISLVKIPVLAWNEAAVRDGTTSLVRKKIDNAVRMFIATLLVMISGQIDAIVRCENPPGQVEKQICSYTWAETGYTLEDLDIRLNETYQAALDRVSDKERLRAEQRRWLKLRNQCKKAKCFNDVYDKRIRELAAIPGRSVANDVTFFEVTPENDKDTKIFGLRTKRADWLLSRRGGLEYFDGGANDFEIVGKSTPFLKPDSTKKICEYFLFGLKKLFLASCEEPVAPNGKPLKIYSLPGNRRDGFDVDNEPLSTFLTSSGWELKTVVLTDAKLLNESNGSKCEPFTGFLQANVPNGQKPVWEWAYFYETLFERSCRFSAQKNAPQIRIKNADTEYFANALLPGGDVLVGSLRIDPETGLPRDRSRIATVTKDQAIAIKQKLIAEYLETNPACQGQPQNCPDSAGVLQYMWDRLPQVMKPYYVPIKK